MHYQKTKNSIRNIISGVLSVLVSTLFPIITRTIIILYLGIEYAGLGSLFSSILAMFSLSEAGIGSAMVYSLYEPIANGDDRKVRAILKLYRKIYRYIGLIILLIGLALFPFLPWIIREKLPGSVNLYLIYLIFLVNTSISYFMFSYKSSVFIACQRNDITTTMSVGINVASGALQILLLILFRNYYLYLLVMPAATILNNIICKVAADRMFPQYALCEGELPNSFLKELKVKVLSLIGHQVNYVIINSADNIVLSFYSGVAMVGLYGNYYAIYKAAESLIAVLTRSIQSGIGNSIITESKDKVFQDFMTFSLIMCWFSGLGACFMLSLYQPFISSIWLSESYLLKASTVWLLSVCFFLIQLRKISATYKNAAGIWYEDRFKPYVVVVVDLALDFILVPGIGVNGIIISTIVSVFFVELPWESIVMFPILFQKPVSKYFVQIGFYCFVTGMNLLANNLLAQVLTGTSILSFIIRIAACFILSNLIFLVAFFRLKEFRQALVLLRRIFHVMFSRFIWHSAS